jgi:hypothetical protein
MNALRRHLTFALCVLALRTLLPPRDVARAYDVVLNAQGEYLDAYLIDGSPTPRRVVFIDPDPPEPDNPAGPPPRVGRHVNGKLCFFPNGFGHNGEFVMADDAYREACVDRTPPQARCAVTNPHDPLYMGKDPDGWAVFKRNGRWTKRHIHTPWDFTDPQPQGNIDPQGCAFDSRGNFWGTDVGHGGFGDNDGSLLVFFPGRRRRYDTYCFLDKGLSAPGMLTMDAAGNIYIPEPAGLRVTKFSPPFPTSAADCDNAEHLVTTPPTKTVFLNGLAAGLPTPAGIARVPGSDHFYIGSVAIAPAINEYDADGLFVRNIIPAGVPKNPLGIDVGSDGTLYYSALNLDPVTFGTRCGSVWRTRFDALGQPLAPEQLGDHLRFPDGVTVVDSRRLKVNLANLPPSPDIDPTQCGGE